MYKCTFIKIYTKKIHPRSYDSCTYLFIYTSYSNPKNKIQRTNKRYKGCRFFSYLYFFFFSFFSSSIHTVAVLKQPCNDNLVIGISFSIKKNFPLSSDTRPTPFELSIFTKKKKKRKIFQTHKPFHHYFSFDLYTRTIIVNIHRITYTYTLPFTF